MAQEIPVEAGGFRLARVITLLVDAPGNRVVAGLPAGPGARDVALSPDGRFAYVTSYDREPATEDPAFGEPSMGSGGSWDDTPPRSWGVTVIDLKARRVHAIFQPAGYRQLGAITVGEGGDRLWVTSETEKGVVEMDAHTGEVRMLWRTGGSDAADIAVNDDGDLVFTANSGSDDVTVIDRMTVVSTRVPAGRRPSGVAVVPAGNELWVANSGDNTISVIGNFRNPREVGRFPSGGTEPVRIAFHVDRREAWISHRKSRTVAVLGTASGRRVARIPLPAEPRDIAFSNDGTLAYVSSPASGRVFTIDVASRRVVKSPGHP